MPGVVDIKFDPTSFDEGKSLVVQPDGAIVYAGITTIGNDGRFGVARLTAGGQLDDGFDGDGLATANFLQGNDEGKSVALQPCGTPPATCIIVAGKAESADRSGDFAWARFDAGGRLDRKVVTDLMGPNDEANDLVVLADGRFVLVGESGDGSGAAIALVRYTAAGEVDTTFGDADGPGRRTGSAIVPIGGDDHAYAAALDGLGRIVAVGRTPGTGGTDMIVVRYTADGALDDTFDGDGHREIRIDDSDDVATGVAIDAAGRIAVAGRSNRGAHVALVRLTADGRDDDGFGVGGRAALGAAIPAGGDADDGAYAMTAQRDGKLVLVGELRGSADDDHAVVRVLP